MEEVKREYYNIIKYLDNNKNPGFNTISQITQNIFISSADIANDKELLKKYSIKFILQLTTSDVTKNKEKKYNIPTEIIQIKPGWMAEIFEYTYHLIHSCVEYNNKILVYCEYGSQESVAIVVNYFLCRSYLRDFSTQKLSYMKKHLEEYKLFKIIKFVKGLRPCAELNDMLVKKLLEEECYIKDQLSEKCIDIEYEEYYSEESSSMEYDTIDNLKNTLLMISKEVESK